MKTTFMIITSQQFLIHRAALIQNNHSINAIHMRRYTPHVFKLEYMYVQYSYSIFYNNEVWLFSIFHLHCTQLGRLRAHQLET